MWNESDPDTGKGLYFGPFQLIASERLLAKNGKQVAIGGRALDILIALTQRPGEILTGDELTKLVWRGLTVEESNLRVHIASLRKALADGEDDTRYVLNVAGRGYTFAAPIRRGPVTPERSPTAETSELRSQSLPHALPSLFGRTETVNVLSLLVLSRRFVTVVGPGGIGKTTVAVAVAHSLRQEFEGSAIYFVDLTLVQDAQQVPNAVASALGCFVQGPEVEPFILAFVSGKKILVVLDNCEHVISAAAALAERLFHAAPSLHLLATSREALRVDGENVHLLLPLDTPRGEVTTASQALGSPAVKLFMEKAASSGHRLSLTDAEAPTVANICRRLDGIALAIELVASRVGTFGIQGTFDLMGNDAELQLQGRRNAVPRHQTLQGMLDWSYNLLSNIEQEVLSRLSIFVGQFTFEAAIEVAGSSEDTNRTTNAIASLVDKSLIWISPANGIVTYRLLDTTRVYAAAKLATSGETDAVAMRHAQYFADFLKMHETDDLVSHGHNVEAYAPHIGNIRQALGWCFSSSGSVCIGIELTSHAAPLFLASFPLLAECSNWCSKAMAALLPSDRGQRRELYLQKALALSSMYLWDDSEKVKAALERGLELSEKLGEDRLQHYLLLGLNVFFTRRGEFTRALDVAKRAAALSEKFGGVAENAMSEWALAASHHIAGNQSAAVMHGERGFRLAVNTAPSEFVYFGYDYHVRALGTYARSLWISGAQTKGIAKAREAISRVINSSHPVLFCAVLLDSIPVLHWGGQSEEAFSFCEQVIAHALRYSLHAQKAVGLALRGELMIARGEVEPGVNMLRDALKTMGDNQYHVQTLATRRALAEGLRRLGDYDEALFMINDALNQADQASATLWLPALLHAKGEVLMAISTPSAEAEACLTRSIEIARRQNALSWELGAATSLARIWAQKGKSVEAKSLILAVHSRFNGDVEAWEISSARQLLDELR